VEERSIVQESYKFIPDGLAGRIRTKKIIDFTSKDANSGYGLVRAQWTPKSDYFVFSTFSSGGHSSWHFPTFVYSVRDDICVPLDNYYDCITKGDFVIFPDGILEIYIIDKNALDYPPKKIWIHTEKEFREIFKNPLKIKGEKFKKWKNIFAP
jgi:hypothetical protein